MKKNTASQSIGCQMITASDGSAFTGSVTVYVTGDAGTQAVGSVGSGACTHEGNGYHTYAPAQAETNYDLIAFTFIGTGAIPATIQVYTEFDANVLSVAGTAQTANDNGADINAILVDTNELQTNQGNWVTATGFATSVALATAQADLDTITGSDGVTLATAQGNYAPNTVVPDAAGTAATPADVTTALGTYDGPTNAEMVAAFTEIKGATWASGTDTLEAIRDRGDAAWITATGFATETKQDATDVVIAELTTQGDTNETKLDTLTTTVGTAGAGLTDLGGMSTAMKAEINAEVVDTLATDTYAEPGQGAPAATASLAAKINYLFKAWRNKTEQTATTLSIYDDAGTTVDQKSTVSDDGTTATKAEIVSGP
jgi:hypothetical protein